MTETRTSELSELGVSIWLDDLSRDMIRSGALRELVDERSVVGITTNPSIFASSLGSPAYDDALAALSHTDPEDAAFALMCEDVALACDELAQVYEASHGLDGRVSIEVSPELAHDSEATVAQAQALWTRVDRPNLFIKIPATETGLVAIARVIGMGISVNATLLFGLPRSRQLVNAYFTGLEIARDAGLDLSGIRAVASVFVSRFDALVDPQLDAIGSPEAEALRGRAGIANARLAAEIFEKSKRSARARLLFDEGAHPLRPLWASIGTKDARLSDTVYVEALSFPGTVHTMPHATLEAFADHGTAEPQSSAVWREADQVWNALDGLGIDYAATVARLEAEGVEKFEAAWGELVSRVQRAIEAA